MAVRSVPERESDESHLPDMDRVKQNLLKLHGLAALPVCHKYDDFVTVITRDRTNIIG